MLEPFARARVLVIDDNHANVALLESALLRKMRWISARPVLPLPSTNGWIVSNCACATAACTTPGRSSVLQNEQRSAMRSSTNSHGGGTYAAEQGLWELPPIQFCSCRNLPPYDSTRVPVDSRWWISSSSSRAIASPAPTCSIPKTIASMLPSTSVAVTSDGASSSPRTTSACSSRRAPMSRPSIRDEATASARSKIRASASVSINADASTFSRASAASASATSAATSPSSPKLRPARRSGT